MDEEKKARLLNRLGKHRSKHLAAVFKEIAKTSPRYQQVLWHHFLRLTAVHPQEVPQDIVRSYLKYQDSMERGIPLYPVGMSDEDRAEIEQKATRFKTESESDSVENQD